MEVVAVVVSVFAMATFKVMGEADPEVECATDREGDDRNEEGPRDCEHTGNEYPELEGHPEGI